MLGKDSEFHLGFYPETVQLGCHVGRHPGGHVGRHPGACSRELAHHGQSYIHGQISWTWLFSNNAQKYCKQNSVASEKMLCQHQMRAHKWKTGFFQYYMLHLEISSVSAIQPISCHQ